MTQTNRDMIKGAMRLIYVIDATEDPAPEDADLALQVLQDLVASWEGEDIYHGYVIGTLSDNFPFEDKHVLGVKNILANALAPQFGKSASTDVKAEALKGYQRLSADYAPLDIARPDEGLSVMPSQRRTFDV